MLDLSGRPDHPHPNMGSRQEVLEAKHAMPRKKNNTVC